MKPGALHSYQQALDNACEGWRVDRPTEGIPLFRGG